MYQYNEAITHIPYSTAAWRMYTEGYTVGFLDLETTGLSHRTDSVILGGLLRCDSAPANGRSEDTTQAQTQAQPQVQAQLSQLLCDHGKEEREMLSAFWEMVKGCQVLVTYNGDSFDLPFLKERLYRCGIAEEFPPFLSLDLYQIFRKYCPMSKLLPDLRQKTVESALGLAENRMDEIDGKESIQLFSQYQKNGEEALRDKILLHNRDDLIQLSRLLKLLDKVDLHRIMSHRGFLVAGGLTTGEQVSIRVDSMNLNKKEWRLEASTWNLPLDLDIFGSNCRIVHDSRRRHLTAQISVMYLQNCIVADLETLPGDYAALARYPAYESGYLILHDGQEAACAAMNHCIKLLLSEVISQA